MDKQQSFFPYSWYIDEKEKSITNIRVYGLNNKNQSVCVKIYDFQPYIYIELPENIDWSKYKVGLVVKKLQTLLKNKGSVIQSHELVYKKKLYYAHIDKDKNIKTFPYLYCKFNSTRDIKNLTYSVKDKLVVSDLGAIKVKIHEQDASPILQLCCVQNIPTAGWIKIYGKEVAENDKETFCAHEYVVKSKNICSIKDRDYVAKPKIMGFDIEVNSSNPSAMPKAEKSGDKIFQISCIFSMEGDDEKDYKKYLLSLGNPDPKTTGEDINIYSYINEAELLEGFTDLILEENPNVIVGYNILGFDIPYMIARAKKEYIISSFDRQGFHKYNHAAEKTIKWSSSAYKNQEFQFLDAEGRLFVDLMPLVKRDYKLDNYKLKTVSEYFLGCFDPNTPILLYNGSVKLAKDIKKGDVLIGDDGTKRNVLELCSGEDDMYEIQQLKGDNYTVNSEHILTLKISGNGSIYWSELKQQWIMGYYDTNSKKFRFKSMGILLNKTKEEVYNDMLKFKDNLEIIDVLEIKVKDYIKLSQGTKDKLKGYRCSGIDWEYREVYIDPYILGMWLGDGDHNGVGFTSADKELIEKWNEWCSKNNAKVDHDSRYNYIIRDISDKKRLPLPFKLLIKKHYNLYRNKHIPIEYLVNDRTTRLQVLAGLIDTDGHVSKEGRQITLTQTRNKLADDIVYLCRSLGFITFINKRKTSWIWKGKKKFSETNEISISGNGIEDIPIVLDYKKCCIRKHYREPLITQIKVVYKGKNCYNGWEVDGNKKFLLKDFTVTHNCTKDDLSPKGIFKCYRMGMKGGDIGNRALGKCGKYCVQDSMLVVKLMDKLQIWVGLTEMACVCNVQPFTLYTQGQQVKVFSQIYKYCYENNIVVEKDVYTVSDKERYVGAHVFDPIPGCYDRVVPFDFASLYPTTIIAYNIDYSTLVLDPEIPDSECHVMDWEDHIGCQHDPKVIRKVELTKYIDGQKEGMSKLRALRDKSKKNKKVKEEIVAQIEKMTKDLKPYQEERSNLQKSKPKFPMCAERHYRFLKEPKGVLPTILQNLLDARKHTRNQMKDITKELKDCKEVNKIKELTLLYNVLDKRQLAYKVSANSAYGALGVRKGYLPFMPGAMCTTYMGRINIELVAKTIPEKYGGELVYGD